MLDVSSPPGSAQRSSLSRALQQRLTFDTSTATDDQKNAFAEIAAFLPADSRRSFLLTGAAGCGKTFLTGELVHTLTAAGIPVILLATTNKAAAILKGKSDQARTPAAAQAFRDTATVDSFIHKKRVEIVTGQPSAVEQRTHNLAPDALVQRTLFLPAGQGDGQSGVVITDEVSMLSPRDAALLMALCDKLVLVGDAHQLPPVGVPGWLEHQTADAELNEIVRQQRGSGIALLGQSIRLSGPAILRQSLAEFAPEVETISPIGLHSLKRDGLQAFDMILAHTNATCGEMNVAAVRQRFPGWEPGMPPPIGASLYVHEKFALPGLPGHPATVITKGSQARVIGHRGKITGEFEGWLLALILANGQQVTVPCLGATFASLAYQKTARTEGAIVTGLAEIGFAYCLTVHKGQGSEWHNVLLLAHDYRGPRNDNNHQRWAYTGVTRAKTNLVVVVAR